VEAILPLRVRAIVLEAAPENLDTNRWRRVVGLNYAILFPQGVPDATR
jgi:hypothetical protein